MQVRRGLRSTRRDTRVEINQGAIFNRSYSLGNAIRILRVDKSGDIGAPTGRFADTHYRHCGGASSGKGRGQGRGASNSERPIQLLDQLP